MRSAVLYLFTIALSKHITAAARIFAWFPTASLSHQVVFRPVTQELAKRGHEVVVVTPDPAFPEGKAPKNLIEIDVRDISYSTWRDYFVAKQNEMTDNLEEQMWIIFNAAALVFEKQMNTPEMRKLIEERNTFDLFLIEGVAYGALAIRHKTNAPLVMINSMGPIPGHMEAFGAPNHPFLYPIPMNKKSFNLTMLPFSGGTAEQECARRRPMLGQDGRRPPHASASQHAFISSESEPAGLTLVEAPSFLLTPFLVRTSINGDLSFGGSILKR